MNKLKTMIVAVAALVGVASAYGGFTKTGTITSGSKGATLQNGTIYTVPSSVTLNGNTGASALNVAANSTAIIYIPTNVTLTVNGGGGSWRTPGGAGIYLPSSSTLYVFGQGRLVAKGGSAGLGANGGDGGSGYLKNGSFGNGGQGGSGGVGGGGAGAGVGGSGGWGGAETIGPTHARRSATKGSFSSRGNNGNTGNTGGNGKDCGRLILLGSVSFKATAGGSTPVFIYGATCGLPGKMAEQYSQWVWDWADTGWSTGYCSGYGAGGGGGGLGYPAARGFGGGAAGGGAGGSGGSGATEAYTGIRLFESGNCGFTGKPGKGYQDGSDIWNAVQDYCLGARSNVKCPGGAAGVGGVAGQAGANGTLYKSAASAIDCGCTADGSWETDDRLKYAVTFDGCGASGSFTRSQTVLYTTNMSVRPPNVTVPANITGMIFKGYYTEMAGSGTQCVDTNGAWVCDFAQAGDLPLYAYWVSDGSTCVLSFNKQSGSGGETQRSVALGDPNLSSTSVPSRSGYKFGGYFTGTGGTGTQIFDSNGYACGVWVPTEKTTVTIYAYWISVQSFSSLPGYATTISANGFYSVSSTTTRNGGSYSTGWSGLNANNGGTSYLYIPSGVTLTCNGGAGSGATNGGAGIHLPSGSTLVVFGGGTLTANGGAAASGTAGSSAGAADIKATDSNLWYYRNIKRSNGGAGGAGGGGAGAGIGGYGGSGGATTAGGSNGYEGRNHYYSDTANAGFNHDGIAGNNGNSGSSGISAGTLYVMGSIKVNATGGSAGGGGSAPAKNSGNRASYQYTPNKTFTLVCGEGGSGGGGGGGYAGYGIGSGGPGGGSGGSGGTGGYCTRRNSTGYAIYSGNGAGGSGASNGSKGYEEYTSTSTKYAWNDGGDAANISVTGKDGGSGGSAGSYGSNGSVYKASNATIYKSSGPGYSSVSSLSALQRTLTYDTCGGTTAGTGSQTVDFQSGFNWKGSNITKPTRTNCDFGGYYTDQFGRGTQHINANGTWVNGYGTFASRKLFAKWTGTITVAAEGQGTVTGGGAYVVGKTATIAATPAAGWKFAGWTDGEVAASRTITVSGHAAYTAIFTQDFDDSTWKGYDSETGTAYATDAEAAAAGCVIRAGRLYYKSLLGAFTNAVDGVLIEMLANVTESEALSWGDVTSHEIDGHGFTLTLPETLKVSAGCGLVISNLTLAGGVSVSDGGSIGVNGAVTVDGLALGATTCVSVMGDLTGSSIDYTTSGETVTTNYAAQAGAGDYFHYHGDAGAYVNDDGEIAIAWFYGTGAAEDPYQVIAAIQDESLSRILDAAVSDEEKNLSLKVPATGLVSATNRVFAIPTGKILTLMLPDGLATGDYELMGVVSNVTDAAASFALGNTAVGKRYGLSLEDGILKLSVQGLTSEISVETNKIETLRDLAGDDAYTKDGAGTLVLTGTNTYTGATSVEEGKLVVEGPLTQSPVTIESGAGVEVRGAGEIAQTLTLEANAYLEVSEDVTLTNAIVMADGSIIRYTGAYTTDDTVPETDQVGGDEVKCLSVDPETFTRGGKIKLVFDPVFLNGTYEILSPLPGGADALDCFEIDTSACDPTKNYELAVNENGALTVTLTTKPMDLSVGLMDENGDPTSTNLTVSSTWLAENLPSYSKPNSTGNKLDVELNKLAKNGMTYWQNYVLNKDPSDTSETAFTLDVPQTTNEPGRLEIRVEGLSLREGVEKQIGFRHRLDKVDCYGNVKTNITQSTDPNISVPLDTGIYKVTTTLADATGMKTSPYELSCSALIGVVRVSSTNRFQAIAAPFVDMDADATDEGIAVSNLVQTSSLMAGDKLHIYAEDGTYKVYTLAADKTWNTVPVVKVAAPLLASVDAGTAADEQIARRNIGAWVERVADRDWGNPTNRIIALVGRYSNVEAKPEIVKGHNLLGAPGIEPYSLTNFTGAASSDYVLVPGAEPRIYTFKDGKWGYYKQVTTKRTINGVECTGVKSVWTTDESEIPAGTGFWLINKSGKVEVE